MANLRAVPPDSNSAEEPAPPADGSKEEEVLGVWDTLGCLLRHLMHFRLQSTLLAIALLLDVAYYIFLPLSLKFLIDRAITPQDVQAFYWIIGFLGVAFLIATASAISRDYLYGWLGANVLHSVRLRLFNHLQNLSMDFFGRARTGDVLARFSTDLSAVENALVIGMPGAFLAVFAILGSCTVMFILEWKLSLLMFLALPFCIIGPRIIGPKALRRGIELRREQASMGDLVQENLNAQKVVKAFSLRDSAVENFKQQSGKILKVGTSFGFLCYSTERAPNVGMALFSVLVLGFGGWFALQGDLTIGSLVSFNALFGMVSSSVLTLSAFAPTLLQASGGLQRIRELEATPSRIEPGAKDTVLPPMQDALRIENVTFSYDEKGTGLQEVSLEIPKGSRVAFVGPSGCGKSTCLNLLLRFFDPDSGKVTFDGVDLRDARLDSLLQHTGVVFQDNFLFNASIKENVRLGRPDATDEEIEEACRRAELHDMIASMPDGYDTTAGEGGNRLSGGQRQRVALARALIRKPDILFLDEATSALDPGTEADVNATLEQLGRHQTTITVTHRLAPLVNYDRIFVFERGRITEAGSHADLLERQGTYASLWSKQHSVSLSDDLDEARVDPESLNSVAVFRDLTDLMRGQIAEMMRLEEFAAGNDIVRQGDEGDKFYIVARGRISVRVTGNDGIAEQVAVLEDGDSFGEVALVEDIPRIATATAEVPTVCLTLRRTAFQRLLEENPKVRDAITRQSNTRYLTR